MLTILLINIGIKFSKYQVDFFLQKMPNHVCLGYIARKPVFETCDAFKSDQTSLLRYSD